jgi:hypothetical protein
LPGNSFVPEVGAGVTDGETPGKGMVVNTSRIVGSADGLPVILFSDGDSVKLVTGGVPSGNEVVKPGVWFAVGEGLKIVGTTLGTARTLGDAELLPGDGTGLIGSMEGEPL